MFEKKLDDKLQGFKEELLRDYNELLNNETHMGFYDQFVEQNTERSDLFILNWRKREWWNFWYYGVYDT